MQFRKEYAVILISFLCAGLALVGDSVVNVLLGHARRDFFLRFVIVSGSLTFGIVVSRMISRHRNAREAMKRQTAAIETSMDGAAICDKKGTYIYVNNAYVVNNGYESSEELLGKRLKIAFEEKEYERIVEVCMPMLHKNGRWRGELLAKRKNGSTYFQETSMTLLEDGSMVFISHDITWRKRSEERARRSERFLNDIFESIRDPFCIFDRELRIIRANAAYSEMKGVNVADLVGRKCYEALEKRDELCDQCVVDKALQTGDPCSTERAITLRDGTKIWVEIYTFPILDDAGRVTHIIEYTRDATSRKRSEEERSLLIEKLEHLSRTDGLTGLMNRRALTDSLVYEFDRAKRFKTALTLVLCDVDYFKEINDRFGHAAGDSALMALSDIFLRLLRKTDIAGRYGGDEFMIILTGTSLKGAESLAEKLLAIVRTTEVSVRQDETIHLSLSIGVAAVQPNDPDIDAMIKRVDEAMYAAKQAGRNRVCCAPAQVV
ncbi:MAG TPA: diguanylate cyclase [Nitrospirota bacterium]|nr:diguanylate cyclase [Nitrospirota bacterium]